MTYSYGSKSSADAACRLLSTRARRSLALRRLLPEMSSLLVLCSRPLSARRRRRGPEADATEFGPAAYHMTTHRHMCSSSACNVKGFVSVAMGHKPTM